MAKVHFKTSVFLFRQAIMVLPVFAFAVCMATSAEAADSGSNTTTAHNRFNTEEITIDPGPARWLAPAAAHTFVATMGTSTPSPNPYRFGASGAVIVDGRPYLIDAGDGVIRAIARTANAHHKKLMADFAPARLTTLFITHLHSDHVVGLPSLILNTWIFGRSTPMEIYGPVGTKNLVESILKAYAMDIHERIFGAEGANDTGWRVHVHEFSEDGVVYQDDKVKVIAYAHKHGTLPSFGYRFETPDRIVVWAGDGQQGAAYQKAAQGADVLVSELASVENVHNSPWGGMSADEKERVIWSYHMKPGDLADLANKAGVKQLVLIHESNYSRPYDPLALLREMQKAYHGKLTSSRDGDVF